MAGSKVIQMHTRDKPLPEGQGLLHHAQAAEKDGDPKLAIKYYQALLKENKKSQDVYQRLMILYRKLKDYKKELGIIDSAIKAFSHLYKGSAKKDPRVVSLSKKLNMMTGLTNKKGEAIHDPEPIAGWKKRKILVEKKL